MEPDSQYEWVRGVKARGLQDVFGVALDTLEPLGPLGAQVLWVLQPVLGLLGWRHAVREIAEALEKPGGVARIRAQLYDHDSSGSGSA